MSIYKELKKAIDKSDNFTPHIGYMKVDQMKTTAFREISGYAVESGAPTPVKRVDPLNIKKIVNSDKTGSMERVILEIIRNQWGMSETKNFVRLIRQSSTSSPFTVFKRAIEAIEIRKKIKKRR